MPTVNLWVDTGFVGAKHQTTQEIPDSEWAALDEQGREDLLEELARDYLHERVSFGAYVKDEN